MKLMGWEMMGVGCWVIMMCGVECWVMGVDDMRD